MADPALADFLNRLRILKKLDRIDLQSAGLGWNDGVCTLFHAAPLTHLLEHTLDADVERIWEMIQARSRTFPVIGRFRVGERVAFASAAAAHLNHYDPTIVRAHVVYSVQCEGQRGPMDEPYTDSQLRGAIDNG